MASTRASSPAGNTSTPTSPQYTPRSKLKAMLAAVDDETSDDESTGPIDTKSLFAAIDKNKLRLNSKKAAQDDSTGDDDDEGTEIIRPRGRVAARMHASFTKGEQVPKLPSSTSKRARQDGTRSSPEHSNAIREASVEGQEEDDDVIIAPSRRRLARSDRRSTPETTVPVDQQSPTSLFVSPGPQDSEPLNHNSADPDSDDNDVPMDLSKNARFKALLEKKRKERIDREAEEERKQIERAQRMGEQMPAESDEDDVSDISDDDGGRKLTQDISRPARKASKKALEEMNRETQRLSRSLQLAHEVKTKKKISKASLFQRFNFRAEGSTTETQSKITSSSRPTTPGSVHQTDAELENGGTPPSSPPTAPKTVTDPPTVTIFTSENSLENENGDLSLEDALTQTKLHDTAKGKAVVVATAVPENKQPTTKKPLRQVRVKLPPAQANTVMVDSDDELEITNSMKKDKLEAVFARIPEKKAQESTGMKILRNLTHLSSPHEEPTRGRNAKPSMTLSELHMSLQQRAKAQAKLERERRLELLRSKGIVVQSAEEREREREQVEDIVAKARQEVEEIMLREREDAKRARKERKQNGESDPLAWDDSDDDSFQDDEDEEVGEVELSGSEEEGEQDNDNDSEAVGGSEDEEAGDGEDQTLNKLMFMNEAEEGQSEDFSDEDIEAMKRSTTLQSRRPKKHAQIISDDEEDDADDVDVEATPKPKNIFPKSPSAPGSGSPRPPTSVLRSATKTFIPGLPIAAAAPAGLGLTQIFAGTMDDSQAGPVNGSPQEFMPSFDQFPDSQFSATAGQSQNNDMISDSQPTQTVISQGRESQTQGLQLHYSQSQAHGFDSLIQADATQMSEFLEPTQDGGFQDFTPLKQRFVDPPQSTVGTLLLTGTQDGAAMQDSPLRRKRGKLLRRVDLAGSSSMLPSTEMPESPSHVSIVEADRLSRETVASSDAFRLMEKAAIREKRLKKKFDKKKSKATEMVEEQAEESEDEYAGLGGADGEDSSDEDEELTKEMIDDTGNNNGDEAKLAGLFADRERAADAAQVDKLFRDITTGMLRKRRRGGDGHDFDLSDSDDGGEARRRMKRQQFAKMQKALFADERIEKIAENPRNAAFLKSIEDRNGGDDEWDFGENFADATSTSGDDSQSQNASQADQAIPDSQPPTTGRKRSRMDDHASRPSPNERRTKDGSRPSSLEEVRRSLSSLLEEPNASVGSIVPATEIGSDSEGEGEGPSTSRSNKENHHPSQRISSAVVDRITLKRNSSSSLSASSISTTARLAFTAPLAAGSGFKVPALLRRATTNSKKLISNSHPTAPMAASSNISQASAGGNSGSLNKAASFGDDGKLKKNAGKRSGINYFAHENERRAKVADAEKRREAKKWKGAEGRSKVVGGLFGSGSFE
ncbi:hypothetical protein HD806DRAFT_352048 [Xylariaceae sp. AK1471]|nr:hypothetical protein HD806DRAFT_352048 [Xylariaceae sp. AK1471]